ncbi:hypothetical protein WA026_019154, partial [Henosepilachna vigintioctopunctata]
NLKLSILKTITLYLANIKYIAIQASFLYTKSEIEDNSILFFAEFVENVSANNNNLNYLFWKKYQLYFLSGKKDMGRTILGDKCLTFMR